MQQNKLINDLDDLKHYISQETLPNGKIKLTFILKFRGSYGAIKNDLKRQGKLRWLMIAAGLDPDEMADKEEIEPYSIYFFLHYYAETLEMIKAREVSSVKGVKAYLRNLTVRWRKSQKALTYE